MIGDKVMQLQPPEAMVRSKSAGMGHVLETKFLLFLIPPVVLATLVGLAYFGFLTQREQEQQLKHRQDNLLTAYGAVLVTPLWEFDQQGIRRILESIVLDPDVTAAALFNERNQLLDRVGGDGGELDSPPLRIRRDILHQGVSGPYRLGSLELTLNRERMEQETRRQILLGVMLLLLLLGAVVISAILAHRLIIQRPLARLLQAIRTLEQGSQPANVAWQSRDELGTVIRSFNHMVERLASDHALLLKSESHFRTAFENAAHGMALIALDGRFLQVNDALCRILGQGLLDLLDGRQSDLAFGRVFWHERAVLDQLLSGTRAVWELERSLLRGDGVLIHTVNTLAVVRDPGGRPLYLIGHIQDVTARRRDQDYRRRNEERLRLLLELNRDASALSEQDLCTRALDIAVRVTDSRIGYLHMVNPDQETIRLVTWNAAALQLCTAAHVTHYPISQAGIWADSCRLKRPVIHNDYPAEPDRKGYPEGHFPVQRHLSVPVMEGGRVHMIIGVGNKEDPYDESDVEQLQLLADEVQKFLMRWRAEAALREARAHAEAANQAKSEFLAVMSHEIRTPLNVLLGLSDELQESPLSGEQKSQLQVVQQAGDHLLALINDILDLSRIEAGGVVLESRPFQPARLFAAVGEMIRARAEHKGLECRVDLAADLPAWVLGDEGRLRQVLVNLLGNAVKFTEAGQVTLQVDHVAQGSQFRIGIRDTGVGIASDRLDRIFDKFSQADPSISRRFGGTGLGLAIARNLVELMGGTLTVTSQLGMGSTFLLQLSLAPTQAPEDAAQAVAPVADAPPSAAPLPLTILLAEDSVDNRNLILTYLRKMPWRVEIAVDGREAVERVRSEEFDLVLMDIQMPVLDGYSATRKIRAWERQTGRRRLPILALSAHALESERQQSLAAGCDAHLTKPIKKQPLLEAIRQAAGRAETRRETS
ncbi:MAG: GAF domain-containing protein [Magnetococcales bacterium]|nr:GAF domain-containing protein [Magnetococcales bacterium]